MGHRQLKTDAFERVPPLKRRILRRVRTSETDPLRVRLPPSTACPLPGRIGLTFAPGKKDAGANWHRNLEADIARLVEHCKTTLLVSLLEDSELALLGMRIRSRPTRRQGSRQEASSSRRGRPDVAGSMLSPSSASSWPSLPPETRS